MSCQKSASPAPPTVPTAAPTAVPASAAVNLTLAGGTLAVLTGHAPKTNYTEPALRDAALRLTAWHNQVWKPVIAAVNGVCAGGGLHFVADADIVRHLNGKPVAEADGTTFEYPVAQPGVYRIEASFTIDGERRPWIYSNPVYVK